MDNLSELIKTKKFVVVDLETTGLDTNREYIIEIGAVKIENGGITEKFSTFVSSPVSLPTEIVELTGITENDLKDAPIIEEALKDLREFMQGCMLVAHNLSFDYAFLRNWGSECGLSFGEFEKSALDTVELAREILENEVENFKLSTLAKYFGIEFTHHRALNDAEATANILIELAQIQLFGDYLAEGDKAQTDEQFYKKALWECVKSDKVSTELIQRKCLVGYNRAVHALDWMEQNGYIGADTNREVKMNMEEYVEKFGNPEE